MPLTPLQILITIFAITLGTMITRFTPFLLFPQKKTPPQIINYLGLVLPAAMMGLLVVYSLKSVSFFVWPYGMAEALSIAVIVLLHLWKRNVLVSIGLGTLCYMILVQTLFC